MTEDIDEHRRRFFGAAAMIIAGAEFAMIGSANAQSGKPKAVHVPTTRRGANTSFASLKQIDAGVLDI
jgi:hypothetical protein